MQTKILYEDEAILVCHKPAGLAVQSANIRQKDMTDELRTHLQGGYLGLVHRLDQPVEGILVCAKTPQAAATLSREIQHGSVNGKDNSIGKTYYAVCACNAEAARKLQQEEGILTDYLLKDAKTNQSRIAKPDEKGAKKAILSYEVMGVRADQTVLLRIHLDTGRHHQIRVQLAHAGFPILGDLKYGTQESIELAKKMQVEQLALCAYQLSFAHPITHKKMTFTIEPEGEIYRL